MKKRIVSIVSIILTIMIILSIIPFSYLSRRRDDSRENVTGFYAEKEDTLDMVYIGGSATYVYWQPLRAFDEYGFTSYDLATSTITPEAIKYYIIESEKTQHPELYVIDLRPFQYGEEYYDDGITSTDIPKYCYEPAIRFSSDSMSYSLNRLNFLNNSVEDKSDMLSLYLDFFKYHRETFWNILDCLRNDTGLFDYIDNKRTNVYKGFIIKDSYNPIDFTNDYDTDELKAIPEEIDNIFIDLLDFCKEEDLNVLFVVNTYCQTKDDKMEYNYMKSVIEEYGFDYLNTNDYFDEIGMDYNTDFIDKDHVDLLGSNKYTDFLADYIFENYKLEDKRDNPEYSEWSELLADYTNEVNDVCDYINSGIGKTQ